MPIQGFTLIHPDDATIRCTFDIMNIESLNQQWGIDDSRVTVQYKIPWASRFFARTLLLGTTECWTVSGTPYLHRISPHAWIEVESVRAATARPLYATKITSTHGLGPKAEPICYDFAVITVVYEDLPYDILSDAAINSVITVGPPIVVAPDEALLTRWVERGPRTGEGRIIQSYGIGFVYDHGIGDPQRYTAVNNGWPFPYYEETISYIWHQVPIEAAPFAIASGMLNKINSTVFAGFGARTLMYVGSEPVYTRSPDQKRMVNVRYKFKFNRYRWDYLPDPLRNYRWFPVVDSQTHTAILFDEDNFQKLFRPIYPI